MSPDAIDLFTVFFYALLTAVATGLGALPFFFARSLSPSLMGLANAVAAGLMIAASFNLIYEGMEGDALLTAGGVLLGLLFIVGSQRVVERHKHLRFPQADPAQSGKMLLIMAVMTLHSFTEGVGVGVSFGGGEQLGTLITAAIALHNVPEGLAISLILVPRGVSAIKAAGWSVFSSLPQPLMAVPAFLFVEQFAVFLPAGLGFAAGAMLWMCVAEILPDAFEGTTPGRAAVTVTLAVAAMIVFQMLIG